MESAQHLVRMLALIPQGIQVLLWEDKIDLIHALIVLRGLLPGFPDVPVLLPTEQRDLQRLGIDLYEQGAQEIQDARRFVLIQQASTESVGAWLNGWRQRLSNPPGTVIVIRRADYAALCRRAPDLMSFAHSDVHEATGLLPLIDRDACAKVPLHLPVAWYDCLKALPGEMPAEQEIANWATQLTKYSG